MKQTKRIGRLEGHGLFTAFKVAQLRRGQGLSYAELARRTSGVLNELALRRIELLERRVDVDDLHRLASALQVHPSELLGFLVPGDDGELSRELDRLMALPESERFAILDAARLVDPPRAD